MQASVGWSPPRGALGVLIKTAADRVRAQRLDEARLAEVAAHATARPSFEQALRAGNSVAVVAEIKRRSPSKGAIAPALSARDQALAYARGGASAISVLTEPSQFGGEITDLDAAIASGLPLLRKDFIIDAVQLVEAAAHGASAALLIVRALPPDRLAELFERGTSLGLALLVEVHAEHELDMVIAGKYPIVGVNNRDLESLEIDPRVGQRLLPLVPPAAIAIYESGVSSRTDVERAAECGADAVLVGSALSAQANPELGVRDLTGVVRKARRAS